VERDVEGDVESDKERLRVLRTLVNNEPVQVNDVSKEVVAIPSTLVLPT
jgi:hypothetical protein